ncbi:MAG: hypothetical protein QOG03_889 [Actinomycetota bacterium]|nr:hypothetical protein [Actinomycetota bacterium]
MAGERYVVLGLAHPRSTWFRSVAQWANNGNIPAEFLKCVSPEELRVRLAQGRPFSAILIDASLPALDRDLVDTAREAGCAVLAVADPRHQRDWESLAVSAVVPTAFDPKDLLDALGATAQMIGRGDTAGIDPAATDLPVWKGQVAMVCGPGGTGTSTVAIALAQGLGDDPRHGGRILLADLALHAEQAMLHDARDVVPGIQELVDAHRAGRPTADEIRSLTFAVTERRYHLLLGLRRSRAWATLRPRAFDSAFDSLRRSYRVVVADTDADLEGESEGGSVEVEERHLMARTAATHADVVFAVGLPGMKGIHALVRILSDLLVFGVPAERVIPVINRSPRSQRARAELTQALAELMPRQHAARATAIHLPDKKVDEALRDGVRLPAALTEPLAGAFHAVLSRVPVTGREVSGPAKVVPGSLGSFADADADIGDIGDAGDTDDEEALG